MLRVLCCGGRNYDDTHAIDAALRDFVRQYGQFVCIHGGARGADNRCGWWACNEGFPVIVVHAPWERYGNRAGSLRNQWMLEHCAPVQYCVAFPGGAGTADMTRRCEAAGITVWRPYG